MTYAHTVAHPKTTIAPVDAQNAASVPVIQMDEVVPDACHSARPRTQRSVLL
jgi:hypothetical protein